MFKGWWKFILQCLAWWLDAIQCDDCISNESVMAIQVPMPVQVSRRERVYAITPCILSWESDGGPEKGPLMMLDVSIKVCTYRLQDENNVQKVETWFSKRFMLK